jgi:hypothetical protein
MKRSMVILLVPLASLASGALFVAGACSSSVPIGVPGSEAVPAGDLPSDVPSACSAGAVQEHSPVKGLCGGMSPVWFVCDGGTFSQYVCTEPEVCPGCPTLDSGAFDVPVTDDLGSLVEDTSDTQETSEGASSDGSSSSSDSSESPPDASPTSDGAIDDGGEDGGESDSSDSGS